MSQPHGQLRADQVRGVHVAHDQDGRLVGGFALGDFEQPDFPASQRAAERDQAHVRPIGRLPRGGRSVGQGLQAGSQSRIIGISGDHRLSGGRSGEQRKQQGTQSPNAECYGGKTRILVACNPAGGKSRRAGGCGRAAG